MMIKINELINIVFHIQFNAAEISVQILHKHVTS